MNGLATQPDSRQTGNQGHLFVVSAPSGAGKTTLCRAARERLPQLVYSVSSTTRGPRIGEVDGQDYFFVSEAQFRQGIESGLWAEWAKVHDNYYGTSARFLDDHLQAGRNVLLDIDVQGARQILQRYPEAVTIFIAAPSMAVLRRRLTARGLDSPEVIELRMKNAQAEMDSRDLYRHVVVNDDLDAAIKRFVDILSKGAG
ncbi:guanylate kinase [uncultured Desulfosarcina sp.]|uniref:guanylate kinase n=1 Tax=uncultured Desulfosarcina sp. TaxID=218289 RepID=UPI0029C7DD49|nr:guanylate kinase [uncultured Desulfosarcina sp.]